MALDLGLVKDSTLRRVLPLVCAAFLADLVHAPGTPCARDGALALALVRSLYAAPPPKGTPLEHWAKMRADLGAVNDAKFAADWEALVSLYDERGAAYLREVLAEVFKDELAKMAEMRRRASDN